MAKSNSNDRKLLIYGAGHNPEFIKYIKLLSGKENPKICFLPTATGDSESSIIRWYESCAGIGVTASFMKVWINSVDHQETWEDILLGVDAIVVGGGNTLNMMAIWKAQGIDMVLKKAYDQGIILAGGSAGSLCWFEAGTTDSRPKELSVVEGLGFLKFSHCPHYNSEPSRRPLYHENILKGALKEGYACDDRAGLLFVNGHLEKGISVNGENNSYFVSVKNGMVVEEKIQSEILK